MLFAFSNISAKRFGTAKRDSYHLAVLNRLVVIFCHTTWWAVSLGAHNDNILYSEQYVSLKCLHLSAKWFRTAKRNGYHLAVPNRLVVKICHNTWCAESIGARNDEMGLL